MKTALFGGAFDPPHCGHQKLVREAVEVCGMDRVILIPSGISPFKGELATPAEDRCAMAELLIENIPEASVSDDEIRTSGRSYSFDTVCRFRERFPEDELYFIIGDDQYRSFPKWYKAKELLALCTFLVFTRDGGKVDPPFVAVRTEPMCVSSTEIRERIAEGKDVGALVPEKVEAYIREHGLYRKSVRG